MNPIAFAFPMAAITAMLFLLWSDFARRGRTNRWWVMFIRMALFLAVTGVLVSNRLRFPGVFERSGTDALVGIAVVIGIGGGAYYLLRGVRMKRGDNVPAAAEEEPLPSIWKSEE